MNFHFISDLFRPKPSHQEPRYYAATKAENSVAERLRIHKRLELAVACAQLDDAQRQSAIHRALTDKKREGRA